MFPDRSVNTPVPLTYMEIRVWYSLGGGGLWRDMEGPGTEPYQQIQLKANENPRVFNYSGPDRNAFVHFEVTSDGDQFSFIWRFSDIVSQTYESRPTNWRYIFFVLPKNIKKLFKGVSHNLRVKMSTVDLKIPGLRPFISLSVISYHPSFVSSKDLKWLQNSSYFITTVSLLFNTSRKHYNSDEAILQPYPLVFTLREMELWCKVNGSVDVKSQNNRFSLDKSADEDPVIWLKLWRKWVRTPSTGIILCQTRRWCCHAAGITVLAKIHRQDPVGSGWVQVLEGEVERSQRLLRT